MTFDCLFLQPERVSEIGDTLGLPPWMVCVHLRLQMPEDGLVWNITECDRASGVARCYVQGPSRRWRTAHLGVLLLCGVRRVRDVRLLTLDRYYPDAVADLGLDSLPDVDDDGMAF